VDGSFSIGANGFVYNDGTSTLKVLDGDFTLGDAGFVYNGLSSFAAATLSVEHGSISIGSPGIEDISFLKNYGTSTVTVGVDFALYGESGSYVYNGVDPTDHATLSVGGNFSINRGTSNSNAFGYVFNIGTSHFSVDGDFTISGNGGSFMENGTDASEAAKLTV